VPETQNLTARVPASTAKQFERRAEAAGKKPGVYLRDLILAHMSGKGEDEPTADPQTAESLAAIRRLSNLLREDVATLTSVMLTEVAKWDKAKAVAWVSKTFHRQA
jgi:hypothetical protein